MTLPGASEVATILGLGRVHGDGEPWLSPFTLHARLHGRLPRYDTDGGGPDAELGRLLEPVVGARFAALTGQPLVPGPTLGQPGYTHPDVPWTARPDFLIPGWNATLEVKAPRELAPELWGPDGSDLFPPYYAVQVLAQVAVAHRLWGTTVGYLAAIARAPWGSRWWGWWRYERDADLEAKVIERVRTWLAAHPAHRPPQVDGSDSTARALSRIAAPGGSREATADEVGRVEVLRRARRMRRAAQDREQQVRSALLAAMHDCSELTTRGGERLVLAVNTTRGRALRLGGEDVDGE